MKITAAVMPVRSAQFEIETLDLTAPLADEVLVRVVASGMCHTDLHARDGYFPNLPYPVVCGHEGAGIVEQAGGAVTDLAPGDPVVISFPWCGECGPCRAERVAYCERARPLKSSGCRADGSIPMSRNGEPVYSCFFQQSSFASFAVAPAKDVVKIRRDAPIEMLGPLGCGLQTGAGAVLNVMQPPAGQSIAVYGVGGVGLAGLMAARIAGCDPIIAVDRLPSRLALARELGATHTFESRGAETLAEIHRVTGGGTDFALETSAVPTVFRLAVDGLRSLGTCILVGSARAGTEVSFEMPWLQGGRTVRGVIQGDSRPRDFIPRLADLFMEGKMPFNRLIARYDFADINRAAADATSGRCDKAGTVVGAVTPAPPHMVDSRRIGVAFSGGASPSEIVDCVRLAESLGYGSAWVAEGHGGDQFAVLAACAAQTSRILLGTSITSVFVRTAPTIAMAVLTTDDLSGGRFILGVGSSHKVQVEGEHGVPYAKPLTRVRETVALIRRLAQDN